MTAMPKNQPLRLVLDTEPALASVPPTAPLITPGLARALTRVLQRAAVGKTDHDRCQSHDLSSKAS